MRSTENEVLPLCIEKGISVLAYSPLQQGLLSGKYLNRGMKCFDNSKPSISYCSTSCPFSSREETTFDWEMICNKFEY